MNRWHRLLVAGIAAAVWQAAPAQARPGAPLEAYPPAQESAAGGPGSPQAIGGHIPLEALASLADVIVLGRVGDVSAREQKLDSEEIGAAIRSHVEVLPERVIKGAPIAGPIVVEVPAGRIGERVYAMEDAPELRGGERLILFLKAIAGTGRYALAGQQQGTYRVANGQVLREKIGVDAFLDRIEEFAGR